MTPELATPEDDRPEPARNAKGQWLPGETGNPGGLPASARNFRRKARWAANQALDRLIAKLAELEGRDLVAATKLLAEHGGFITPEQEAALVLRGRQVLGGEEWVRWSDRIEAVVEEPPDTPALASPEDTEEDTLP